MTPLDCSAVRASCTCILSLLPSAIEILFDLGLGDQAVGVTFECDFLREARNEQIVSTSALPEGLSPAEIDLVVKVRMSAGEDLYQLDRGAFSDIAPTMVFTQNLCAVRAMDDSEVGDAMTYLCCRADVVTLDPMTLDEVIDSVMTVGAATNTDERAAEIVGECRQRLATVAARLDEIDPRPTLLLEWIDPAFIDGHWVPDIITAAGGRSMMGWPDANSQGASWEAITDCAADVVIIAPCSFRLDGAQLLAEEVVARRVLPAGAEEWAVDADAFGVRPGPRVVQGVEVFASILHPTAAARPTRSRSPSRLNRKALPDAISGWRPFRSGR